MKIFITKSGMAAERQALATGTNIKISTVVVDDVLLPENKDPRDLIDVQNCPTDQSGLSAIYPVALKTDSQRITIAWTLPATSGGYMVKGLGFKLADGTLWGYQRAEIGYKPPPEGNAFFEPHGTVMHATSSSELFTCNLNFDGLHATLSDVSHGDLEILTVVKALMRKTEGKLGRVRLYAENDIDPDYLPLRGQTINRSDYPDYFEHKGVTGMTLKLPDWGNHGYVRQFNDSMTAGTQLEQQVQIHNHDVSINASGQHTPTAQAYDLGSKSGNLVLNSRFSTNSAGAHNHGGTTAAAGAHTPIAKAHDFGNRPGSVKLNKRFETHSAGGHSHTGSSASAGSHKHINGFSMFSGDIGKCSLYGTADTTDTSYSVDWNTHRGSHSPYTSTAGSHSHSVSISPAPSHWHYVDVNFGEVATTTNVGAHTILINEVSSHSHTMNTSTSADHAHYVDVNFGTKTIATHIGSFTIKLNAVASHVHNATCSQTGYNEGRPKTTIAVYAVKVKYIVDL